VTIVVGLLAGAGVFLTSGRFAHIAHEHDWEREDGASGDPGHTHDGLWMELHEQCGMDPGCMADRLARHDDAPEHLARQLSSDAPIDREEAIEVAAHFGGGQGLNLLAAAAPGEPDPLLRLRGATILIEADDRRGFALAVELLTDKFPPLIRDEAHQLLLEETGRDCGYDPFAPGDENTAAITQWRAWLADAP
jgi:hypothetical protein